MRGMMRCAGRCCAGLLLTTLAAAPVAAQVMDFGVLNPKLKEAQEAGIGSYHLVEDEKDVFSVEVWDREGEALADCEVRLKEQETTGTCSLAAGGSYRLSYTESGESFLFEDLDNGEAVTVRFEFTEPVPEGLVELGPGESLEAPGGEWIVTGSKTQEEAERDWKRPVEVVAMVVGEVLQTLGIPGMVRGASVSELQEGGESFACGPGERRTCTGQGGVFGSGVSLGVTRCCSAASQDADVSCLWVSRNRCCANTLCTAHCLFGQLCRCTVGGLVWRCLPCV